jgi:integrase/recombinase XerD
MPHPDGMLRMLPISKWPAEDRAAWTRARMSGDVFTGTGPAAHWSDKTACMVVKAYGQWLSWFGSKVGDPDRHPPLRRIVPETVESYARFWLEQGSTVTALSRVRDLYEAIRVMHESADLDHLKWVLTRLRARAKPVRQKAQLVRHSRDLFLAGRAYMEAASDPQLYPTLRSARYRDGLIIALLAFRPIRIANLGAIEIGRNLHRRAGQWWLQFAANEVKDKGGDGLEFVLPDELTIWLEPYLQDHRPILLRGRTSKMLWVSTRGSDMTERAIYQEVVTATRVSLGIAISPHLFRDCAATTIAMDAPADVEIVARILGHRTLKTGERHYIQARMLEGSVEYRRIVERLRRDFLSKDEGS